MTSSTDYNNLRVRAWLQTPVVGDAWLPLDGILLYQWTRRDLGAQDASISGGSLLQEPHGGLMQGGRMPIAIVHARDWYYRCSWAQWGSFSDGADYWSKRFDQKYDDLIEFGGRRGKVDTSAGQYKAYRMPVYYRSALWVEWYLTGQMTELMPLIYMTTHLGKKTSQGWGRVAKWEIEVIENDWAIWKDGRLMRGIPRYHWPRNLGEPAVAFYGIRPSYWDQRNQMELVMP